MVLANEATKILTEKYPGIKKHESWEGYYLFIYPDADPNQIYAVMTVFSRYVEDLLNAKLVDENEIKKIFLLVEFFIENGEDVVKGAACADFLENLINATSWGTLKPEQFIHYLGPKSKKFCKKWDEFTGVPTPGLWKEGEFKGQRDPVGGWL